MLEVTPTTLSPSRGRSGPGSNARNIEEYVCTVELVPSSPAQQSGREALEWRPHLSGTFLQDLKHPVTLLAFQDRTTAGSSSCYVDDTAADATN